MLKIEAIIRPEKLEMVCARLRRAGYPGMTVLEVQGHGRQGGLHAHWPQGMRVDFLPKVRIEIVVEEKDQAKVTQAIVSSSRTGDEGDGKIFISEIKDAIRIRTGEKGKKAISMEKSSPREKLVLSTHSE
jgi:nitrogen regulatory protein P-II 1